MTRSGNGGATVAVMAFGVGTPSSPRRKCYTLAIVLSSGLRYTDIIC